MQQAMGAPELLKNLGKRARQRVLDLYKAEKMIGEYQKLLAMDCEKKRKEGRG